MALLTPTDICNRALQRVGASRIAAGALTTENSKNAAECAACYDNVRRAELRRNAWTFSARRVALRPYETASNIVAANTKGAGVTKKITFGTWAAGTTYAQFDIVTGSNGQIYMSRVASNVGNDPTLATSFPQWELYFGVDVAQEYVTVWVSTITYDIGANVIGSDGNSYMSVVTANLNHNPVGDGGTHWVAASATATKTSLYSGMYSGEMMYVGGNLYFSLVNQNTVDPTTNVDNMTGVTYTNAWMQMSTTATLANLNFSYPIGAGPVSQTSTRNVFRLPVGFLRKMPQQPKAGSQSVLGAPTNLTYDDWEFNGKYLLSATTGPILLRFAADVQDTTQFDPMFDEGLSCRIALEVCETLTQSTSKLQAIGLEYKTFMGEARTVNAIEQEPTELPLDDLLQVRY